MFHLKYIAWLSEVERQTKSFNHTKNIKTIVNNFGYLAEYARNNP